MKVAINALAATCGGAITHLGPFLASLGEVRPDWELVAFTANDVGARAAAGVEVVQLTLSGRWSRAVAEFQGVDRRAVAVGADCVVNLLNSGALRPRLPTITWQRNALYFDRSWLAKQSWQARADATIRRSIALLCCRASDAVAVPSRAMAGFVTSWPMARQLRVRVVPHAVDTSLFPFRARDLERRPLVMGVMGGPAAHRGLDTAVEVLNRVRALGVDARLQLTVSRHGNPAGQQRVDDAVRAAERTIGVGYLDLTGPAASSAEWYDQLDILLVPSKCESFGFPLVEALASGLPVIASGLPALHEVGGDVPIFVAPNDPSAFVAAVMRLAGAPAEEIAARTRRGRAVAEQLTWPAAAEAAASVVEEVLMGAHEGNSPTA